jgi:hypothetical protein
MADEARPKRVTFGTIFWAVALANLAVGAVSGLILWLLGVFGK